MSTSEHDERFFRRVEKAKASLKKAWKDMARAYDKTVEIAKDPNASVEEKTRANKLKRILERNTVNLKEMYQGSQGQSGLYHHYRDLEGYMKRRRRHPEDYPDSDCSED